MKNKVLNLVTLESPPSEFKYVLGVFSSGAKADAAGWYEIERRRLSNEPGNRTLKVTKIEVDKIYSNLNVDVIEKLKNGA